MDLTSDVEIGKVFDSCRGPAKTYGSFWPHGTTPCFGQNALSERVSFATVGILDDELKGSDVRSKRVETVCSRLERQ